VAEVSARFTLDAMPGKQMSIDADMRSGTIDFKEARRRRNALARESQFFGAMDGAMKFVKGDAMAGIIITVINIVGGLIIGVAMNGMPVMDAVQTYSILTIGDGLVSQIPALLISISAGMVVTRVASEDENTNLGKDIATQILAQPKAIGVASGILLVMGLIPGLPKIPFLLLASVTGGLSFGLFRTLKLKEEGEMSKGKDQKIPATGRDPEVTLTVPLVVEAGPDLAGFLDLENDQGQTFYERLVQLRNALYQQFGVIFPPIRICGSLPEQERNYVIWLNESPAVSGRIPTDCVLVNSSAQNLALFGLQATDTRNPATGKPAAWLTRDQQPRAEMAGLQIWDSQEVLLLHMASFLRKHAKDFVGLQETQWILNSIKQFYPNLVDEVVPKPVTLQQLTNILQRLVEEEVSIRDVKTILQALSQYTGPDRDIVALTEHVRASLKRKICYQLSEGKPTLFVYQLDEEAQDVFTNSVRQNQNGPYLAMDPENVQRVFAAAARQIENLPATAQPPVILADSSIRRFVKRLLEQRFPEVHAISYNELTPDVTVQPIGTIALLQNPSPDQPGFALAGS
jgi:type III secretion protein V